MANRVDINVVHQGPRNAIFHVYLVSDGVSGDLVDEVIVDPATLNPALAAAPILTVEKLWYDLSGFSARLEYDYLATDAGIWTMSEGQAAKMDFSSFSGINDTSGELDGTGKIKLSTSGFTDTGDAGSIIIHVKK